ncbi:M24 family metallopeptidase [Hutsoniella sourekii]
MSRLTKVRSLFAGEGIDALLVTELKNLYYLANFTGTAGVALIGPDYQYFITDFRYKEQASQQSQGFEVIIHSGNQNQVLADLVAKHQIQNLGYEADQMVVSAYIRLDEDLDCSLVATAGLIETVRQIKDAEEIAIIKQACEITDQAFSHILTFIKPGVSELEVANELERFCKSKGASAMSFDTIIASGYRSAMPHGVASDKLIEAGDMITMDFGCYYKGYASDMTRTVALGSVDPKLEVIYQIVLEAHQAVIDGTKAGMTGREVDDLARDIIKSYGYGDNFGHSTGHGVGLDIHEEPAIAQRNQEPLEVGMVITDEPGIYIDGLGGVRIEDDLLVTQEGVEILNRSPKNLIII